MKIAIMQPYIFPYIGYFQLIRAVDIFIFYDDVNFIRRGWINRNQLLVNSEAKLFTIPLLKASQNKLINEVKLMDNQQWLKQFYTTLEFNYKKAPHFNEIFELIRSIFGKNHNTISDLSIDSVKTISNYLSLSIAFEKSSTSYPETKGMDKADRLIEISKIKKADVYINPSGGKELYQKEYFRENGIELSFINNQIPHYNQNNSVFVAGLSIIDVLMYNSKEEVLKMLDLYQII